MKSAAEFVLILVTAPNIKVARSLSKAALAARVIACANIIPKLESHYWWRGKIQSSAEVLLVLKTTRRKINALEKLIMGSHPYDTPEFLVLPLAAGNARYLKWLADALEIG